MYRIINLHTYMSIHALFPSLPVRDCHILDLSTKTWSPGPPMRKGRYLPDLVAVGEKVYAIGGKGPGSGEGKVEWRYEFYRIVYIWIGAPMWNSATNLFIYSLHSRRHV